MIFSSKPSSRPFRDVLGGIAIAIVSCYLLINLPDLLRGEFRLDPLILRNLLLLGVPVLLFGWYENRKV